MYGLGLAALRDEDAAELLYTCLIDSYDDLSKLKSSIFCCLVENRSLAAALFWRQTALLDEFIMQSVVAVAVYEMATLGLSDCISFEGLPPREFISGRRCAANIN